MRTNPKKQFPSNPTVKRNPLAIGPLKLFLAGLTAIVVGLLGWLIAVMSGLNPHGPHPAWEEPLLVAGGAMGLIIGPTLIVSAVIWSIVRRRQKSKL
jgi:hypothetical protein